MLTKTLKETQPEIIRLWFILIGSNVFICKATNSYPMIKFLLQFAFKKKLYFEKCFFFRFSRSMSPDNGANSASKLCPLKGSLVEDSSYSCGMTFRGYHRCGFCATLLVTQKRDAEPGAIQMNEHTLLPCFFLSGLVASILLSNRINWAALLHTFYSPSGWLAYQRAPNSW